MADASKKKVPKLMEDGLDLELKPADVSQYLKRGFEVLANVAEDPLVSLHDRFHALQGLHNYYGLIVGGDIANESLDKMSRVQNRTLDEVKRLRHKDDDWKGNDEENGEE